MKKSNLGGWALVVSSCGHIDMCPLPDMHIIDATRSSLACWKCLNVVKDDIPRASQLRKGWGER